MVYPEIEPPPKPAFNVSGRCVRFDNPDETIEFDQKIFTGNHVFHLIIGGSLLPIILQTDPNGIALITQLKPITKSASESDSEHYSEISIGDPDHDKYWLHAKFRPPPAYPSLNI
jgi:hypothetical protein